LARCSFFGVRLLTAFPLNPPQSKEHFKVTTATIASRIKADLLASKTIKTVYPSCFCCGQTFSRTDASHPRFCSNRCVEAFGNGVGPVRDTIIRYTYLDGRPMREGRHGFFINCAHCSSGFESKGFRCCSPECDKLLRLRKAAGPSADLLKKRQCANPTCSKTIPAWSKGRRVSKAKMFCSDACGEASRRWRKMLA
jgi:hypothetical protein